MKSNPVIVTHSCVFGTSRTEVRKFDIGKPRSYAQYRVSVDISFVEPGKRRGKHQTVVPDNIKFITVEQNGAVVYDSRTDVPCDMVEWRKRYAKERAEWLEHQAEIDRENAERARRGELVHTEQMGDFRFDELANQ